jgi:hypothetical protein
VACGLTKAPLRLCGASAWPVKAGARYPKGLLAAHGRALTRLGEHRQPPPAGGKLGRGVDQRGLRFLRQNIPRRITVAKWMTEAKEWAERNPPNVRAFAKWYFDLIKNAFVVVALAYASQKTGYISLKIVSTLSTSIFCWELVSYPLTAILWIRIHVRSSSPSLSIFITVLAVIVSFALVGAVGMAGLEVIEALFDAQFK